MYWSIVKQANIKHRALNEKQNVLFDNFDSQVRSWPELETELFNWILKIEMDPLHLVLLILKGVQETHWMPSANSDPKSDVTLRFQKFQPKERFTLMAQASMSVSKRPAWVFCSLAVGEYE